MDDGGADRYDGQVPSKQRQEEIIMHQFSWWPLTILSFLSFFWVVMIAKIEEELCKKGKGVGKVSVEDDFQKCHNRGG
ncbi:hypothetical protein TNCV_1574211 [Trichonephila clavipes]|nr:hypothetical protein TNCV_1574211 [Trichonephila clavipes]